MKIKLHDPVIVSQAPPEVRGWGPWQFPMLQRMEDGGLLLEFHRHADSAVAYGLPMGQAVSYDEGRSWREIDPPTVQCGLRLPNGDQIRAIQIPSIPVSSLNLPAPLAHLPSSYDITYTYYRKSELPAELQTGWAFRRKPAGCSDWINEYAQVEIPHDLVYTTEGVFVFPYFEHDRIHLSPAGTLTATLYGLPHLVNRRVIVRRFLAIFLESADLGCSWRLKSVIPYYPDRQADPAWDARDGFTEPQFGYLPDGSLMCLLRTTDGNGIGPLYAAYSQDDGASWNQPKVFDSFGVWAQLLTLANGVTLAAYGRPGLFLRATSDPAGRRWGRRITVVPPLTVGHDTCSYSDLIALSENEALIAYSHFNTPGRDGKSCKTILTRRIEII